MENLINKINSQLENLKSEKQKEFSSVIVKNIHPMLGVKIPDLRTLAKQISKTDAVTFLNTNPQKLYEQVILQGMVIGCSKLSVNEKLDYLKNFITLITDWSECDTVVSTLKFFKTNLQQCYSFFNDYFLSDNEFEKRFAIVCYLNYFLTDYYIDEVLQKLVNVKSDFYYVNMAVAWALSVCFIKYYNKTLNVFKNCKLDNFTFNKTIQKCIESFRLTNEQKQELKNLKRK